MKRLLMVFLLTAMGLSIQSAWAQDSTYSIECKDHSTSNSYSVSCTSDFDGETTTYEIRCTSGSSGSVHCTDSMTTHSSSPPKPRPATQPTPSGKPPAECVLNEKGIELLVSLNDLMGSDSQTAEAWKELRSEFYDHGWPRAYRTLVNRVSSIAASYVVRDEESIASQKEHVRDWLAVDPCIATG